jgi:hypothetical protein
VIHIKRVECGGVEWEVCMFVCVCVDRCAPTRFNARSGWGYSPINPIDVDQLCASYHRKNIVVLRDRRKSSSLRRIATRLPPPATHA